MEKKLYKIPEDACSVEISHKNCKISSKAEKGSSWVINWATAQIWMKYIVNKLQDYRLHFCAIYHDILSEWLIR
jgi:hypothetical protein